ncbi:MAG TPA: phosphatidylcholine/phosphatidylserine synthase [Rhizobiaceae bacterium]
MVFRPFPAHGRGGPRIREIPLRMILPNLITVLAICAGLSGIRFAFEARFETAVAMVLFAAFLDGIDGRVARMMKATSKFGAQMDSLADIVNFGVAPALVLYAFLLDRAGSPGWIAALLFAIACGLRLARFNVLDEDYLNRPAWQEEYFVGVPAPAGAVLVLLPVYLAFIGGYQPDRVMALVGSGFTVLAAFLLVSRIPVYSGKTLRVPRDRVLPIILAVALFLLLLFSYPWHTLSAGVIAYLIFLPLSVRAYSRRAVMEEAKAKEAEAAGPAGVAVGEEGAGDGPAAEV